MSKEEDFRNSLKKLYHQLMLIFSLFMIVALFLFYYMIDPNLTAFKGKTDEYATVEMDSLDNTIEDGIHLRTGFVEAEGLMTVVNNCTNCHSAKLVIQNRMSKERWDALIRWMQDTQNLWDLGDNQEVIVNYLVENYPVENVGRRAPLTDIDWYELED